MGSLLWLAGSRESCCSVTKSHPNLWPHRLQYARAPCPPLSPGVHSSSCPLSQWCYVTISSSAALFSFCLQSFSASEFYPVSWLFMSGGQSIGASALASVLPVSIQGWFPLGLTGWISFQSRGCSRTVVLSTTVQKHQFWHSPFFMIQLSHPYITSGKNIA